MTYLGKYQLHEELGRGGYGTVYRAYDTVLEVERTVKVLHPALVADPEFIERFKREAQLAAQLEHPHIVPVFDLGEDQGRFFLVMKYMPGGSLKDVLEKDGRLHYERAVEITTQIANALDYTHQRDIVHRDVKPGNILFDEDGTARIADFGFAKALSGASASLSASGGMVGTPAYMAPEVWREQGVSPATDVYSLACVVFEMLTGEVLFEGDSAAGVMTRHLVNRPQFPKEWPQNIPNGIGRVLGKALAKELVNRFSTAKEFVAAVLQTNDQLLLSKSANSSIETLNAGGQESASFCYESDIGKSVENGKVSQKWNKTEPSKKDGESNLLKQIEIIFFTGIICLLFGWFVIGYALFPVEWSDAGPADLTPFNQEDYLRMVIDSYTLSRDQEKSVIRWKALNDNAIFVLSRIESNPGTIHPSEIAEFRSAVWEHDDLIDNNTKDEPGVTRVQLICLLIGLPGILYLGFLIVRAIRRWARNLDTISSGKFILLIISVGIISVEIGWIVLAWGFFPVWTDALPSDLIDAWKEEYLRMAIDSYSMAPDDITANRRWNEIGKDADQILKTIVATPDAQTIDAVSAFIDAKNSVSSQNTSTDSVGPSRITLILVMCGFTSILGTAAISYLLLFGKKSLKDKVDSS